MKNTQKQNDELLLPTQINCISLEKTNDSLDYTYAPAMQPETLGNSTIDVHNRKMYETHRDSHILPHGFDMWHKFSIMPEC